MDPGAWLGREHAHGERMRARRRAAAKAERRRILACGKPWKGARDWERKPRDRHDDAGDDTLPGEA